MGLSLLERKAKLSDFKRFIKKHPGFLQYKSKKEWCLLTLACRAGNAKVINYLLSIPQSDADLVQAMLESSKLGALETMRILTHHPACAKCFDLRDEQGWTLMHWAVHDDNYELFTLYLQFGSWDRPVALGGQSPPQTIFHIRRDSLGRTAFYLAIELGRINMVHDFIESAKKTSVETLRDLFRHQ